MAQHFIRDLLNPLGAEYGATSRGADSAAATRQSMDDMLALAMAQDERGRQLAARDIYARKQREAGAARIGRAFRTVLLILLGVFCVFMWQLGDDGSSVSAAYNRFMATPSSQVPDDANAPARAVRAPADTVDGASRP